MPKRKCATCEDDIEPVVEPYDTYWISSSDGDSLSYSPTLHDHHPADTDDDGPYPEGNY